MLKTLGTAAILFLSFQIISCNKQLDQPPVIPPSVTYDTNAQQFFDSTGIADTTQKTAINSLVKQLKDSLLWSQFVAIYPMVGGSSATTKWNLKDPRNIDPAYRLTFNGSPVFSGSGVLFPTTSDYADTHLTDSAIGGFNNSAISYYSTTQNTVDGYDMGCSDNTMYYNEFAVYNSSDASNWFGYDAFGIAPASTVGLFMLSSTATDVKRYENGIATDSKGSAPVTGYTNMDILLGTVAGASSGGQRQCSFATIGKGLSDAQALTFYNIVNKFMIAISR
jgi:hypothetical protein